MKRSAGNVISSELLSEGNLRDLRPRVDFRMPSAAGVRLMLGFLKSYIIGSIN